MGDVDQNLNGPCEEVTDASSPEISNAEYDAEMLAFAQQGMDELLAKMSLVRARAKIQQEEDAQVDKDLAEFLKTLRATQSGLSQPPAVSKKRLVQPQAPAAISLQAIAAPAVSSKPLVQPQVPAALAPQQTMAAPAVSPKPLVQPQAPAAISLQQAMVLKNLIDQESTAGDISASSMQLYSSTNSTDAIWRAPYYNSSRLNSSERAIKKYP